MKEQKIELAGALNVRDLGGYPTADGGRTKSGVYFRADSLHSLTDDDIAKIKALGVTMQLDLRSAGEASERPSRLEGIDGIEYLNICLLDNIHSGGLRNLPKDMAEMYCEILRNSQDKFAEVFRALINNSGSSVFNCTAGKDRTGITALLLLNLAGVGDEAIIFDYALSGPNMEALFGEQIKKMAAAGRNLPDYLFLSEPDYITAALSYLKSNYKDAEGYLIACGLNKSEVDALKASLKE
jgi:protein-tyrosine phosphatase